MLVGTRAPKGCDGNSNNISRIEKIHHFDLKCVMNWLVLEVAALDRFPEGAFKKYKYRKAEVRRIL